LTIPLLASTSTRSPFFNALVAIFVPIMQGFFNSLATIAAWQVMPPSLVIMAADFFIAGRYSGLVNCETKMSPSWTLDKSSFDVIIFTLPFARPLWAMLPLNWLITKSCLNLFSNNLFSFGVNSLVS